MSIWGRKGKYDHKYGDRLGTWSQLRTLAKSPIARATALIPVIGYAILWSSHFTEFLQYNESLGPSFWFDTLERLYLIYLGASLTTLGVVIFELRCPKVTKKYADHEEILDYLKRTNDSYAFGKIQRETSQLMRYYPVSEDEEKQFKHIADIVNSEHLAKIYNRNFFGAFIIYYYSCTNSQRSISRLFCGVSLLIGCGFLALPSIEVFWLVSKKIFTSLLQIVL